MKILWGDHLYVTMLWLMIAVPDFAGSFGKRCQSSQKKGPPQLRAEGFAIP